MRIKGLLVGFLAVAGLGLTSCQTEDLQINEQNQNQAIGFGTYMSKPAVKSGTTDTKALEALKTSGFGVFAHYTGTVDFASTTAEPYNFMFNQKVDDSDKDNSWTYSPVKYWPNTPKEKVSFFAYAPYVAKVSTTSGITKLPVKGDNIKDASLTYKLANATGGVDLLWASATNKKASDGKVKFAFKHALSQIAFKVKTSVDGTENGQAAETKVFVESISIQTLGLTNEGTLNLATGAWTTKSVSGDGEAFTINSVSTDFADNLGYTTPTTSFPDATGVTSEAKPLFGADKILTVIPNTGSNFRVTIKYHVLTQDKKLEKGFTDIAYEVSNAIEISTASNKIYTITMNLGLNSVKFGDPTVTAWTTGTLENGEMKLPEITK